VEDQSQEEEPAELERIEVLEGSVGTLQGPFTFLGVSFGGALATGGRFVATAPGAVTMILYPSEIGCGEGESCVSFIESLRGANGVFNEESESGTQGGDPDSKLDEIVDDAEKVRKTRGGTTIKEKDGGLEQLDKDADSIGGEVDDRGNIKIITLPSGRKVIAREKSSDGRPTLEVQRKDGRKVTEIRYN
jgi:hypothetical protein